MGFTCRGPLPHNNIPSPELTPEAAGLRVLKYFIQAMMADDAYELEHHR
jgi:hypothetical protein